MQTYHAGGWTNFLFWVSATSMLVLWVAWRWQAHKMHWIREWRWHTGGGGGFGGGTNDWADINQDAGRAEADVAAKER